MHPLEKELSVATKVKKKDKERRHEYLARLAKGASDLPEDSWDKLSTEAQDWANAGVKAINAKDKVDDFETADAGSEAAPEKKSSAKASSKSSEKPAEKSSAKGASKSSDNGAEKASSKKSAAKPEGEKKPKALATLKGLMIKNMNLSVDDLEKKMRDKGFETSRIVISTARSDFRHAVRCLQDAGMCKELEF